MFLAFLILLTQVHLDENVYLHTYDCRAGFLVCEAPFEMANPAGKANAASLPEIETKTFLV